MNTEEIGARLTEAGCRFYHAINLRAFATYCAYAAIVSREQLKARDAGTTPFWSDPGDEQRGVMDRVFGNLYDFGEIYSRSRKGGSPNIYGPIMLVMSPATFDQMKDIIITTRSIVSLPGDWRDHALEDAVVEALLVGDDYGSPIAQGYQFSELSCENNALPFATLERVIVDPLDLDGLSLLDEVKRLLGDAGLNVPAQLRRYDNGEHLEIIRELAESLYVFQHKEDTKRLVFQDVPEAISKMDRRYQRRFETWMTYFYFDTVCYVRDGNEAGQRRLWDESIAEWRGRAVAYFDLDDNELEELADRGEYHPKHNPDVELLECRECSDDSVVMVEADVGVCTNLACREVLRLHRCERCGEPTAADAGDFCASCRGYIQYQMDKD